MAGTVAVQSLLAGPLAGSGLRGRTGSLNHFLPANHTQGLRSNAGFGVRAMKQEEKPTAPESPSASPLKLNSPSEKPSTKLFDIFSFDGPAPERINGRLAMVGFAAALAVELSGGQNLFSQIQTGGAEWFVGTSVLLTLASLIPQLKGMTVESQSVAPMTSDAELWNGRLAMVGLVALAFTEFVKGGTLV